MRNTKHPVIGVILGESRSKVPGTCHKVQSLNSAYFKAIEEAGGLPVAFPADIPLEEAEEVLGLCDGFLLPGGEDVDPGFYGQDPSPFIGKVNLKADLFAAKAVSYAAERRKPVLAICRGMQLLNTALGGTLYQDISEKPGNHLFHLQKNNERDYPVHKVTVKTGSRLAALLGKTEVFTNTLHHQCVCDCGERLKAVAHTSDGVIEAVESEDGLFLAVQWHPEELLETVPCMRQLFSDLISRA